jgi:hypothetical protein
MKLKNRKNFFLKKRNKQIQSCLTIIPRVFCPFNGMSILINERRGG